MSLVSIGAFAVDDSAIENPGFEDGPVTSDTASDYWRNEDPVIPGWNWLDGDGEENVFDLGVSEIGECVSIDTANYSNGIRGTRHDS